MGECKLTASDFLGGIRYTLEACAPPHAPWSVTLSILFIDLLGIWAAFDGEPIAGTSWVSTTIFMALALGAHRNARESLDTARKSLTLYDDLVSALEHDA